MGACYIGTDLWVRARFDLSLLHAEFARFGLLPYPAPSVYRGIWSHTYGGGRVHHHHPSQAIDRFLEVLAELEGEARDQWDRCIDRRFNIGYDWDEDNFASHWQINPATLQRVADVNGSIVITIYRSSEIDKVHPFDPHGVTPP